MKFSGYCFHMSLNEEINFESCISVPVISAGEARFLLAAQLHRKTVVFPSLSSKYNFQFDNL